MSIDLAYVPLNYAHTQFESWKRKKPDPAKEEAIGEASCKQDPTQHPSPEDGAGADSELR